MYKFTKLQLTENEFNNLAFMGPPPWWIGEEEYPDWYNKEKCPKLPVQEEHKFLHSLCLKPFKHVVQKVIERSGLDGQNLKPTEVFENIDIIARYDKEPWFKQHTYLSRHFRKSLMGTIWIRNLAPNERNQCSSKTFYVEDGNHRALVYAAHIACGVTTYEPVEAIHATSWEPASKTLGHSVQPATVLENNGKLQKNGRSRRLEATTLEESLKCYSKTIKPTSSK
jgi:hypothetical protein